MTQKTRKAYKVVSNHRGSIQSAIACWTPWSLSYSLDTWTEANVGGILVFDELEDATEFAQDCTECEVYECECEGQIELPYGRMPVLRLNSASNLEMEDLWMSKVDVTLLPHWPVRIRAFKRIKLTKRVDPNEYNSAG